ncbi:amidase [Paracidovorax wautersii]|uniref:amidase n=1 Tax=Paracidovorax wautersii TaxID=1177982 RepID=UPI0031DF5EAC
MTATLPDLCEARSAIRAGATTALEQLDRAQGCALAPACRHAFVSTSFEHARRALAQPGMPDSPLAGLAVSVKDLFDVEGEPTVAGAAVLQDALPAQDDSAAVARLRAAGAVFVGRTHMSEFAFSAVGINPHRPTPRNVADTVVPRIPGGSSSGAAVSVAAGAAFIGLGSDTGGSIRTPAALNGVVGFKPTARRVPLTGTVPLSPTLDTVGAVTRSVRDAIVAHEVLAARTVRTEPRPPGARRLAVPRTLMLDALDDSVAEAFSIALSSLAQAGFQIEEIDMPVIRDLGWLQSNGGFAAFEAHAWHRDRLARDADRYDPRVLARILKGQSMADRDYIALFHARRAWTEAVEARIADFDALLSPTVPIVAPPIADVAPGAERDDLFFRTNALLMRNTSVVNMLDGCALTLPCHGPGQLPVGLMVWHGCMRDDAVLGTALDVEAALGAARTAPRSGSR